MISWMICRIRPNRVSSPEASYLGRQRRLPHSQLRHDPIAHLHVRWHATGWIWKCTTLVVCSSIFLPFRLTPSKSFSQNREQARLWLVWFMKRLEARVLSQVGDIFLKSKKNVRFRNLLPTLILLPPERSAFVHVERRSSWSVDVPHRRKSGTMPGWKAWDPDLQYGMLFWQAKYYEPKARKKNSKFRSLGLRLHQRLSLSTGWGMWQAKWNMSERVRRRMAGR